MNGIEKNVLVIGGAGYIGSMLTGMLLEKGYRATVYDSLLFGEESLTRFKDHPNFELINGDIRDITGVNSAIRGKDAVILLAALVGEPACDRDANETLDINLFASVNILETCRYYGINRFLFASTDSCYGIQEGILYEDSPLNPISLYAELKCEMEKRILAAASREFHPTILRLATVYGLSPRMRFDLIINILTMHAVVNNRIKIFGGKQWRPLVHVADVARAFVHTLEMPLDSVSSEIFNIGSNDQNYQIGTLGDLVVQTLPGIEVDTIEQPPDLRDYHVNFDKAENRMGFISQWSVEGGILEIEKALRTGVITDPGSQIYRNA